VKVSILRIEEQVLAGLILSALALAAYVAWDMYRRGR